MRRAPAILVVAVALLAGCAGLDGLFSGRASEEERAAFARAEEALPDDPALAEERLEAFLRTWPKSPLADDAAMGMAEIALARGDPTTSWFAATRTGTAATRRGWGRRGSSTRAATRATRRGSWDAPA
jgi:hypothetical protein